MSDVITQKGDQQTLAQLLDARLVKMGDIAEIAEVSSTALARYRAGQSTPHPDVARRLSAWLGITLDQFYAAYERGVARKTEAAK